MSASLKKAFEKAAQLPVGAPKQLAARLQEDFAGEMLWDETLARSPPVLEQLVRKALARKKSGQVDKRTSTNCEL